MAPLPKNTSEFKKGKIPFSDRTYNPTKSNADQKQVISKLEIPAKKANPKQDASIFHGKSQASRMEIKKELKTLNPKDYGLKMKKVQMAELEKLFPGRFGGIIDHAEAKQTAKELYWEIKRKQTDPNKWREAVEDRNKLKLLEDIIDDDSFKL